MIRRADLASGGVFEKGEDPANLVTVYDKAVQDYLERAILRLYPEAVFMAEEQENDPAVLAADCCFVIDPIDGTANFVHGLCRSVISVAMLSRGVTVMGAVYDPYNDDLYFATLGGGAFLNGRPIRVSDRAPIDAMTAFGTTPYEKDEYGDVTFALAEALFRKTRDVRRFGAAALDLAYVAAGRCDMFFEMKLSPWDIAAGLLLVSEAGGRVSDMRGGALTLVDRVPVLAASAACYDFLLAETKAVSERVAR
jgi:myo-inositol-1(or 4)-monophosphatase